MRGRILAAPSGLLSLLEDACSHLNVAAISLVGIPSLVELSREMRSRILGRHLIGPVIL